MIYHSEPFTRAIILKLGGLIYHSKPDQYAALEDAARSSASNAERQKYFKFGQVTMAYISLFFFMIGLFLRGGILGSPILELLGYIVVSAGFLFCLTVAQKLRAKNEACSVEGKEELTFKPKDLTSAVLWALIPVATLVITGITFVVTMQTI